MAVLFLLSCLGFGFPFVVVAAVTVIALQEQGEGKSPYAAQNSFKSTIILPQPPQYQSNKSVPPCLAQAFVCLLVITTIRFKHSEHVLANGLMNVY